MGDNELVLANVIVAMWDIPKGTLYRLAQEGRIPAEIDQPTWSQRKRYRFRISDVEAVLGTPKHPRP